MLRSTDPNVYIVLCIESRPDLGETEQAAKQQNVAGQMRRHFPCLVYGWVWWSAAHDDGTMASCNTIMRSRR